MSWELIPCKREEFKRERRRKRIGRRGRGYMRALKDADEWLGQDHRRRGARRRRLSSGGALDLREVEENK